LHSQFTFALKGPEKKKEDLTRNNTERTTDSTNSPCTKRKGEMKREEGDSLQHSKLRRGDREGCILDAETYYHQCHVLEMKKLEGGGCKYEATRSASYRSPVLMRVVRKK